MQRNQKYNYSNTIKNKPQHLQQTTQAIQPLTETIQTETNSKSHSQPNHNNQNHKNKLTKLQNYQ